MKSLQHLKTLIPWFIAGLIFIYLFKKIPPDKVLEALKQVHLLPFIGYSFIYFLLIYFFDSYSLAKVVSKFCVPISLKEILGPRAVSYQLSLLNYNAGQASLAYFLKKNKNASFFKALGALLFVMIIDLYWVITFALVGTFSIHLHYNSLDVSKAVQKFALLFLLGIIVHLCFWRQWLSRLFKVHIRFKWADWIRGRHLFQTFHQATVKDYITLALYRFPMHFVIIASLYPAVKCFDAHISLFNIMTTIPVVLLISVVPITPGGMGSVQMATIEFLKDKISGPVFQNPNLTPEQILFALSLLWMLGNYFFKALSGFVFMKKMQGPFQHEELPGGED